jgi:exoribonuclease R
MIAHKGPSHTYTRPSDVVAQHMLLTNKLIARSMRHIDMPFIYRDHFRQGDRGTAYALYNDIPLPHESLKAPQYCHFTSPLRRFPDLANHINLAAIMNGREPTFDASDTKEIASYMNQRMSRIPHYQKAA